MKFLVTGGAGFIGSAFTKNLVQGNYLDLGFKPTSIQILDLFTYAGKIHNLDPIVNDPRVNIIRGDIANAETVENLVKQSDFIINFAAESHVDRSIENADNFVKSNFVGVNNILNSLKTHPDKRFLQVSTDEVYGSLETGSATEDFNLLPNSPYAATKAAADLLVRSYIETFRINAIITRSANNFGPNQDPEKLIPKLIQRALHNQDLELYGDGNNVREWVHVDDNCRGISICLAKGTAGEIYNIGGSPKSNNQMAKLILECVSKSKSKIVYIDDRKGHDFRYSLDDSKITTLGYKRATEIDQNIKDLIQ